MDSFKDILISEMQLSGVEDPESLIQKYASGIQEENVYPYTYKHLNEIDRSNTYCIDPWKGKLV